MVLLMISGVYKVNKGRHMCMVQFAEKTERPRKMNKMRVAKSAMNAYNGRTYNTAIFWQKPLSRTTYKNN